MGTNTGAATDYPSGAHEFTPGYSGVDVTRSLFLYVMLLSVLPFTDSHCPFGIFRLFILVTYYKKVNLQGIT